MKIRRARPQAILPTAAAIRTGSQHHRAIRILGKVLIMTTQIGAIPSDPYVTPDTIPPAPVAGVLETTITASLQTIVSGTTTVNAETYNGAIPGPTLRLNVGDTAIVRLINKLPYPTGIHWHGIELANSADGTEVTQDGVVPAFPATPPAPPGGTYLYKFKVHRPGCVLVPPPPPSFSKPCVSRLVRDDRRHRPGRDHALQWRAPQRLRAPRSSRHQAACAQ